VSATGGNLDVAGKAAGGRKLIAVVYADMVGYSRLIGLDDAGTLHRLRTLRRALIDPAIREHGGRVVQTGGDSLLVAFDSIDGAVRCAVRVQQQVPVYDGDQPPDRRIRFRIGINIGDVIPDGTDLHGDGVNIAVRLEAAGPVGGICVSRTVRDHVHGQLDLAFEPVGELTLKNIARPVEAFVLRLDPTAETSEVSKLTSTPPDVGLSNAPYLPAVPLALPDKPSVAVLPFRNMSGDPEQEYFADGITEDITTALSRLRWFFVIARNSSFTYKRKVVDVRLIAHELGVRYVLEGSVRKGGDRLRVTAQLIDATTGNHIWAQRYDREVADFFALQDDITSNVVATIEPQLYAAEDIRAKHKRPESLNAWDCVARALSLTMKVTKHDNAAAQDLLKKAIAIDPSYAQAHSILAFSLSLANSWSWQPSESVLEPAWDFAQNAVRLDVDDPWAHLALGHLHRQRRELEDAVAEFQNAVALNPNFAFAHTHLGLALCFLGRSEEALVELDTAERLSPRDFQAGLNNTARAIACFIDRRYRDGVDFARRATRQDADSVGAHHLVVVNSALAGEVEEARKALQTLKRFEPDLSLETLDMAVYARDEDRRRYFEAFRLSGLE
jgi:adenylate cyclase